MMLLIWRRFVVWLRSIAFALATKKKISWPEKVKELSEIIVSWLQATKRREENTNHDAAVIPDYDLAGPVNTPSEPRETWLERWRKRREDRRNRRRS